MGRRWARWPDAALAETRARKEQKHGTSATCARAPPANEDHAAFRRLFICAPPPGASFRHDSEHEKGSRDGKRKSAPKNTARRKIISLKEASHQNKAPKKPGKRLSPKGKAFPS